MRKVVFSKVIRKDLEEVTLKPRRESSEEVSKPCKDLDRSLSGKGNSWYKGPNVDTR